MRDLKAWLPDLAPPPGGLARLRGSIQARRTPPSAVWPAVAAACVALVLAVVLLPGWWQPYRAREELVRVVQQTVQPPSPGGLQVIHGAAVALESGQAGVRLYLVQSARAEEVSPSR